MLGYTFFILLTLKRSHKIRFQNSNYKQKKQKLITFPINKIHENMTLVVIWNVTQSQWGQQKVWAESVYNINICVKWPTVRVAIIP